MVTQLSKRPVRTPGGFFVWSDEMPRRPRKPCAQVNCPELVEAGERYCPKHKKQKQKHYDQERGTAAQRGYNSRVWRKVRNIVLRDEPLCRRCKAEGKFKAATVVHHIDEDSRNNLRDNLEPLCERCHNRHHGWGSGG